MQGVINLAYLASAVLFIFGLKRLQSPATARRGNVIASTGMLVAVVATLFLYDILDPWMIVGGLAIGGAIGVVLARQVEMTAMPELVAAFNGFGGLASALVASAEVAQYVGEARLVDVEAFGAVSAITIALSILIGTVTFSGSFIAFGKLSGSLSGNPVSFPGMRVLTSLLLLGSLAGIVFMVIESGNFPAVEFRMIYAVAGLGTAALILGVLLVIPIGGADMPVVVSLLNSYSGLAAAATGFVLSNTVLIISGSLVGASGIILTRIMCRAMNRSLANVLFGGVGAVVASESTDDIYEGKVKSTSAEEVAMILKTARRVAFVPGYGMAVARAQTPVRILSDAMESDGVEVQFGIHPVAGRMPGHMNVLLAEENISYDKLKELDQINNEFRNVDVVIVLGANDVVNPVAREEVGTPISGMPILNVDEAQTVIVIKRSLSPGFAGIPNPLFVADNALMLFGDGKKVMEDLVAAYAEA